MASLLELSGLGWSVPDFSTLSRRQKTLGVTIPYRGSKGALHLLVDSTGIKVEGEGEWHSRKHGASKRRVWRKVHIGIDEETLEIRAVEVTSSNVGDAPMLPELLKQIGPDQEIATVTAELPADAPPVRAPLATPTIRAPAMTPSPTTVRQQSFRPAATPGHGSRTRQAPGRATGTCGRPSILAGRSGGTGAGTTAAAGWKRK